MDNVMIMFAMPALSLALFIALILMNWRKHSEYSIEPCVSPLVNTMNATGAIETMASCGGHFLSGRNPYVSFKSGYYVVMLLEGVIQRMYWDKKLHYLWGIYDSSTGREVDSLTDNEIDNLTDSEIYKKINYFTLTIPYMQNTFISLFLPRNLYILFSQKLVDEDFLVLSETVQKLKDDPITSDIFKGETETSREEQ